MSANPQLPVRRLLVIDDNAAIHGDFRKILTPTSATDALDSAKAAFLGAPAAPKRPARGSFSLDAALQGREGVELAAAAVRAGAPYLVAFVDMRMPPGLDGVQTIHELWRADPELQVVICTAYSDQALDKLADELGRSDQLLILKKPFDPAEVYQLAEALSRKRLAQQAAAMKLDELERLVRERTAEIEHAMLHDKLTGLPNRTQVLTRLEACMQRRPRADQAFAVLFIDLDGFKLVNDSLGHEVGDLLLIEVAGRLRNSLRASDLVAYSTMPARLGGDEFIVLLEDLRQGRDSARVAERLLRALAEPYEIAGNRLLLSASVGVTTSERTYERPIDMIRDADTAMYRAKAAGRGRYVLFDQAMHEEVMRRLSLETALRHAVSQDELYVAYQPIINLAAGELAGFEALVRWNHPKYGSVPANELVSVAEETGLIQQLTDNVLRAAAGQLARWQAAYNRGRELVVSVNLSPRLLLDPETVNRIVGTIREIGIAPKSMAFEITETMVLSDRGCSRSAFDALQQTGVWVHLDDFGTGYSSLSCLYRWPFSGLKIDREFVREACARREHSIVLRAIVDIARAFGLRVIAEGVETTEQHELLKELRVEYGQGYLYGKPCSAAEAESLLMDMPTLCHA